MSTGNALAGSVRPGSSQRPGSILNGGRPQTSGGGGFSGIPSNHGRISSKYLPYALLDFDKMQVFVNSVSGTPENPLWAGDNTQYKFDVSRVTDLNVHLYIRNPNAPPGAGRSQDIFIGVVRITPRFEERHKFVEDPKASKKDREKAAAEFANREKELGHVGVERTDPHRALRGGGGDHDRRHTELTLQWAPGLVHRLDARQRSRAPFLPEQATTTVDCRFGGLPPVDGPPHPGDHHERHHTDERHQARHDKQPRSQHETQNRRHQEWSHHPECDLCRPPRPAPWVDAMVWRTKPDAGCP